MTHPPSMPPPSMPRGLGRLVHRAQASAIVAWLIFGVGMVLFVAWAGLSLALLLDQRSRGVSGSSLIWGPLGIGVFFLPLALIFSVKGYRGRILRFDLYENGVAFEDYRGRQPMTWDEVISVFSEELTTVVDAGFGVDLGMPGSRQAKVTIVAPHRVPIILDNRFPKHVEVAAMVRDAAARAMFPRIDAAIQAGERVYFGAIGIDRWGLHLANATYPWPVIAQVFWQANGATASWQIFGANGARLNAIDTRQVPNEGVFRTVLERFGKAAPAYEQRAA